MLGPDVPYAEKIKRLRQEFAHMDLNQDSNLSRDELFRALDDMNGGKQFDRSVATQLYDRMDQNHDGTVTLDEFIKVFMEAEEVLTQKIERANAYIIDFQKQRQEAVQKLSEQKKLEQLNQHGIMVGSVLTVSIMEVQDLPIASIKEIYVKIVCEGDNFQTEILRYTNNLTFNEVYTAEIITGLEEVRVMVLTYDPRNRDEVLGEVTIPVRRLRDQYRHDELFDLHDPRGHPTSGKIHLVLQWIHSRVKYLEDVVKKWDDHIRSQIEDKADFERDLNTLYEPFKGILQLKGSSGAGVGSGQQKKQPPSNDFSVLERGNQFKQGKKFFLFTQSASQPSYPISQAWFDYAYIGSFIVLAFALLACFARNTFLDVLIALTYIFLADSHLREFGGFRTIFLGALGSICADIIWLLIHAHSWANSVVPGSEPQKYTFIFCLVMSYFLLFAKVVVAFLYYRVYQGTRTY